MLSINSILPKPKNEESRDLGTHSDSEEETPSRVIPPYGSRSGWRPKDQEDFGDGGAFPEVHVAQYPLGMGKKKKKARAGAGGGTGGEKTLALTVNQEGKVDYGAIARQGHGQNRIVQTSYQDLIPLKQRASAANEEISLDRPSQDEIQATTDKTKAAIDKIIGNKVDSTKPQSIAKRANEATYIRYTPSAMMGQPASGSGSGNNQRILKVVDAVEDPLAPPKFKHTKVPNGPPSPPAPVLRSPPRKLTAKDQQDWYIPPSVSNWKNPKGFTIELDKRVAADGRRLQQVEINDNKAKLAEALYAADRSAREEIRQRAAMKQKLAEKDEQARDERLRQLAQKAREEREERERDQGRVQERHQDRREREARSGDDESQSESDTEESRKRAQVREQRKRDAEKELRYSRMGAERRIKAMARDDGRDISERVALGVAKPTKATGESQFDSRLFTQTSSSRNFNEDEVYDRSLFAGREALQSIYRPRGGAAKDADEEAEDELSRFASESRFESLGRASKGFKGADSAEPREGPVEFEKDSSSDPFGVSQMISEVESGRYGLEESARKRKRDPEDKYDKTDE